MRISRRSLLAASIVGTITGIAGCSENASVESGGNGSGNAESGTGDGGEAFGLGETAVFSTGDGGELSFTPTSADLHDVLVYSRTNSIYSEAPEASGRTYLTINVEAENTGEGTISLPTEPTFVLDGNQYDFTYTSAYSESGYESYQELQPGATSSGWLVYAIEPTDATGRLVADFQTFGDSATAEWRIDVGSLQRERFDYSALDPGEPAELGTDDKRFSVTAVTAEETQSYTYSSGSYEYEREASAGNKFVLVTISAENTGESTVSVPDTYDISLLTESSQYDSEYHSNDTAAYDGGEIAPGVSREGIVQFEVPESVSSYQLQVALTSEIRAQWRL